MIFVHLRQKNCNFAHKSHNMEKILRVHNVNDYARYIGAPELHPPVQETFRPNTIGIYQGIIITR